MPSCVLRYCKNTSKHLGKTDGVTFHRFDSSFKMACRKQSIDIEESSQIAQWFDGRSVFITGASGFMGKVLVEKLLSACPGVGRLFLLMRNKKNVAPEKRLHALKQMPIFDKLRKSHPMRLDKLVAVSGDITLPDLGLSSIDKQTLREVSVVFHTAATVKFDEALKLSVSMNILATVRLVQICKSWPNLESFVHVSTAYCNCDRAKVEERIYPSPANLSQLIAACECLDDDVIDDITKRMIGNRPNTYTFTKAMGEQVILDNAGCFPIAIFRPSIVTATHESPMPGWVDNLNGPTGLLVGAGKGVVRSLFCKRELIADLIPVDIAINTMIAVAWQTGIDKSQGVKVYNCTTGLQNPISWGQIERWGHYYLVNRPLDDVMWYPGGSFKGNRYFHSMCVFLFQVAPAYIFDYSAWLLGKKPKISMVRLQQKLQSAISSLQYFTTNEWTFFNDNVQSLQARLTEADRQLFNCDVTKIRWKSYMEQYVMGARKYMLKEEDSNIENAKKHMRKMFILHHVIEFLVFFFIVRGILSRSETARTLTYSTVNMSVTAVSRLYKFLIRQ